jgi:hypothetical protein
MDKAGAFLILGLICVGWGVFQLGLRDMARNIFPHTSSWPIKLMGYMTIGFGCLLLLGAMLIATKAWA